MPYTADKPKISFSTDELRAKIPGWGVDLDPRDRPSVPRERFEPTGAHWDFPERQEEKWPRERSVEHKFLTPVFGTACPPKGVSGAMRKYAYGYSEGRAAHWLILLAADRVDAVENHLRSFATLHPDNPITETGVLSELTRHGIRSRFGHNRADLKHMWLDPIIVAGPWVVAAGAACAAVKRVRKRRHD
ncbi:MAG: hypothetical protein QOF52_3432 [Propionibacteriaceae bacterium]|jgi:hypothetical protein|nr:hypothetical protein [Propionibacteriaceae bacterium]MDX6323574.1 hypothetical protein [Propionibacteriaceae bacterium]